MKKIHLFSLFLIFVFLFCSCDNNVEQLKEGITPVITAEKEAVDSFSKIGEVKTVISIDPALLFPSSRSAVVSLGSLPEDQDGITSIFHLVTLVLWKRILKNMLKNVPRYIWNYQILSLGKLIIQVESLSEAAISSPQQNLLIERHTLSMDMKKTWEFS